MANFPLLATGVAPGQVVEAGSAGAAVAATFTQTTLLPKRISGVYEWTYEMQAQIPEIESALRRGIWLCAVKANMNQQLDQFVRRQTRPITTTAARIKSGGFLTKLTAPTPAPSAESSFSSYAGSAALGVDGLHAVMENECSDRSCRRLLQAFELGLPSWKRRESGIEGLKRRSSHGDGIGVHAGCR